MALLSQIPARNVSLLQWPPPDAQFFNAPVLLVVVGCIIFFVTFFGCCGAVKENHCMTVTFSVLLALIFLLELGAGIGAYMMRTEVRGCSPFAKSHLRSAFTFYCILYRYCEWGQ